MGSFFQRTLGFIQAIAGRKLHLQFLRAIPLFTFTHNSCVMSTICYPEYNLKESFQRSDLIHGGVIRQILASYLTHLPCE